MRARLLIILAQVLAIAAFPLSDARPESLGLYLPQQAHSVISGHAHLGTSTDLANDVDVPLPSSSSSPHDRECAPDCCGLMCHVMAIAPKTLLALPLYSRGLRVPVGSDQLTDGLKERLERPPRQS